MKKLESLNKDQLAILDKNRDGFIDKFLNNSKINKGKSILAIEYVYSLIGKPLPAIYETGDPMTAQYLANKLAGTEKKFYQFGTYLCVYWASFYAWAETYVDLGIITKENNPEYFKLREFIDSNIFMTIEFENAIILVEKPMKISRNEIGMHDANGPAIYWENGYGQYYVNGRSIPEKYFKSILDKTFTVGDFVREENEEIKSACIALIQEKFGDTALVDFFRENLKEVDTFVDKKDKQFLKGTKGMNVGVYTLLKGSINNEDIAYVRCYCPSTDRMFFLGVDSVHTNAKDAIASLYRIPSKLKTHIKSISRQGERFSTVLTEKGKELLSAMTQNEIENVSSIDGNSYFKLMQYEY